MTAPIDHFFHFIRSHPYAIVMLVALPMSIAVGGFMIKYLKALSVYKMIFFKAFKKRVKDLFLLFFAVIYISGVSGNTIILLLLPIGGPVLLISGWASELENLDETHSLNLEKIQSYSSNILGVQLLILVVGFIVFAFYFSSMWLDNLDEGVFIFLLVFSGAFWALGFLTYEFSLLGQKRELRFLKSELTKLNSGIRKLDYLESQLTELPHLPPSLETLICSRNKLTKLPNLPCSLEKLDCWGNQLKALPRLPDSLKELICSRNQLETLPELPPTLKTVNCYNNQIKELPELPLSLEKLDCPGNELTELPELPPSLEKLDCSENELTELPKLPLSLEELDCSENNLKEIYISQQAKSLTVIRLHRNPNLTKITLPDNFEGGIDCHNTNLDIVELRKKHPSVDFYE